MSKQKIADPPGAHDWDGGQPLGGFFTEDALREDTWRYEDPDGERDDVYALALRYLADVRRLGLTGRHGEFIQDVTTWLEQRGSLTPAQARGVVVCGTSSRPEPPVELTWALMLALARNIVPESSALRAGGSWQSTVGADLGGQTLGVLGLGRVGTRVTRVAQAFDMDVAAWSENLTAERAAAAGVRLAPSRAALLEQSDFVSIHLVLSDRTRGLIGAEDIERMKPSAFLINTSRAAIVDQEALVAALRDGRIAGAAVDVFEEEPLPKDHVLRTLPNLLATPHLGYVTRANYSLFYREAVEDISAFLDGAPIRLLTAPVTEAAEVTDSHGATEQRRTNGNG